MKLRIRYDINTACKVILQEQLDRLEIPYEINGMGEVQLNNSLSDEQYRELELSMVRYGIEIIDNLKPRSAIAQRIQEVINEMVYKEDRLPYSKVSDYLTHKLKLSHSYLSKIFSDVTHTSIESYIILQRIERAKQLIIEEKLTLSEVAWRLNYSSLAHLSNQFKKNDRFEPYCFSKDYRAKEQDGINIANKLKQC